MVRARRLVIVLAVLAMAAAGGRVSGQPPAAKPAEPIDRLAYRIRVVFAVEPGARIDARRRSQLLSDWGTLARRFVGAPWEVEIGGEGDASALGARLEALGPDDLAAVSAGVEKVWVVRAGAEGPDLAFSGREFDVSLGRLGPLMVRTAPVLRDAPRVLFQLTLDLFSPSAEIGETFGKEVTLAVRGASVVPASPVGRVVAEGQVFQPLRLVPRKDGPKVVRVIPDTFLRVESAAGPATRCSFVSLYANPFTKMVVQKTTLAAIGVKAVPGPTRLRFLTLPDRAPAAGYVLTARSFPDGPPRTVGTTDRAGRVTLEPRVGDGLLVVRLLAGGSEPMIELPVMPGLYPDEHTVRPFDPKPLAVTLETRLDSLRDSVVDLVAVRARLEARVKARFNGEDWDGAKDALAEFGKLPPRETFADALARLKDEAARQQARTRQPVLTKTAQAQIAELQALIDRYLDDEVVKGFTESLEKLKADPSAKPKPKPRPAAAAPARKP